MISCRVVESQWPSTLTAQTLKGQAASLSETIYQFTRFHILEDLNFHQQSSKNFALCLLEDISLDTRTYNIY